MSPVLRLSRTSDDPMRVGSIALRDAGMSARAHPYAGVPGMALVVVPDGSAVPMPEHFHIWSRKLADLGFTSLRTGALSTRQAGQAERAGLRCVQELALLELSASRAPGAPSDTHPRRRTHRLLKRHLPAVAQIDRVAFGPAWWLDEAMLDDVRRATPMHRARIVRAGATGGNGNDIVGFLISGRAGRTGYIQRLAVRPDAHRQGVATDLMLDSLRWMRHARLQRTFVNTHIDNIAALTLYRAHGFVELPERLRVFEGPTPL
jgi:ribosomal protein S18 acetylase RimI-like enzyme